MNKAHTALLGFGNVDCVVVADQEEADRARPLLEGHPVVLDLDELEAVDVAILALPSRASPFP
ncbi:MAG: hypothetical protein JMJ93_03255 [Synergistaceae bacterium]|nr:hypothetical protein [Synergistaceae bacterium]